MKPRPYPPSQSNLATMKSLKDRSWHGLAVVFNVIFFLLSSNIYTSNHALKCMEPGPKREDRNHDTKNNTFESDLQHCKMAMVPSNTFIPIFVLTRDRISSLQTSLESYQHTFNSPYEIIILDHNSTYPPMVQYLHELEVKQKISVVPLRQEKWSAALNEANSIIRDYLDQHPSIEAYVFTDPDIAFLNSAPDVLLFYAGLLRSCPTYKVVGPSLKITDIPSHYNTTLSNGYSVYEHESQFWRVVPNIATWNGVGYHVVNQLIDTTFAMYRRNTSMGRLSSPSVRAYAPYAAVHVDWYYDTQDLPADKIYYLNRQKGVNNW